jgi:hypothetical protein
MSGRNDSSRFAARSLSGRLSLWADKKPGWAMRRGALKRGESRTLQPNPGGLFGRRFFVGRHKAPQGFIRRRIIPYASESCRSTSGGMVNAKAEYKISTLSSHYAVVRQGFGYPSLEATRMRQLRVPGYELKNAYSSSAPSAPFHPRPRDGLGVCQPSTSW